LKSQSDLFGRQSAESETRLVVTRDFTHQCITLEWEQQAGRLARAKVTYDEGAIRCELHVNKQTELLRCALQGNSVHSLVRKLLARFPLSSPEWTLRERLPRPLAGRGEAQSELIDLGPVQMHPLHIVAGDILEMAKQLHRQERSPLARVMAEMHPEAQRFLQREERRLEKERLRRAAIQARVREAQAAARARAKSAAKPAPARKPAQPAAANAETAEPARPIPPVPVHVSPWPWLERALDFGGRANGDALQNFQLVERAAQLWVSNQSDDLLCLPHCRIERFEYQVRSALRAIGALRGRALLSDEVGLGKTIEAGLVLKEYITRGMVRRFLVVTLPSLVDQWQEELESKFGLRTVTTNSAGWRTNPAAFWQENDALVVSLHTLKIEPHLTHARQRPWEMLIVDEAHHLRNQSSKAWQAISALPRQFLLLLTATPVQNSLDELYNLVTLLRPGQLPPPGEFARRFIDPKEPRRPREPEELRRLLGQVMIRNTRANAGITLPSRRAETVFFEPPPAERERAARWELELRERLAAAPAQQASMSGRILLQSAGSSPAAWRSAMQSFFDTEWTRAWLEGGALGGCWQEKIAALPALAQGEGGVVIFSQFIATQEALAAALRGAGVRTWLINGQTPPPERQPLTDAFQREGGALLLTRSGTEGRNLQFCHQLVNFDLPWNPMEIEQRIGRLHRIGQTRAVRIYNFVETGTLQAHLLEILQEKLNLFELVVGETGLILGERFGSDDFSEEIFRCWRDRPADVGTAMDELGDALAAARAGYREVKELDETLFSADYETV
jgi:hypothetical protein